MKLRLAVPHQITDELKRRILRKAEELTNDSFSLMKICFWAPSMQLLTVNVAAKGRIE